MLRRLAPALAFLAAAALALPAQDAAKPLTKVPEGKFSLNYGGPAMQRMAIVELAVEDGKPVAKLVSPAPSLAEAEMKVGTPAVADGASSRCRSASGRTG